MMKRQASWREERHPLKYDLYLAVAIILMALAGTIG